MTEKEQLNNSYRSCIFLKLKNGLIFDSSDFLTKWGAGEYKYKAKFEEEYMNKESLKDCTIYIPYATFETVEQALVLTEFLKQMGVTIKRTLIGYVSYSRQDRDTNTEPRLCHFIITLIGLLTKPAIIDMHNEQSLALFNIEKLSAAPMFYKLAKDLDPYALIIAPDKGAAERLKAHGVMVDGHLDKERTSSGVRSEFSKEVRASLEEKVAFIRSIDRMPRFFIIDDICDGGRTFVKASKELKSLTNGIWSNVYLMVSHAILPFGVSNLSYDIKKIYTLPTAQVGTDNYVTNVVTMNELIDKI